MYGRKNTHLRKTIIFNKEPAHLMYCKPYTSRWQTHNTSDILEEVDCLQCIQKHKRINGEIKIAKKIKAIKLEIASIDVNRML